MKKQLVASLAAAMVLGIAGTSFAAANPFVDVPAKHWSYESVLKLQQAGIVDGSNGQFQGDRTMTRYEMAQVVAKAMGKSDKADAAQKAELAKLQVEFADELNKIGVRVDALEKKQSTIKFTADARVRWNNTENRANSQQFRDRFRLNMTSQINDSTSVYARYVFTDDSFNQDTSQRVSDLALTTKGLISKTDVTLGRYSLLMGATGTLADTTGDVEGIMTKTQAGDFGLMLGYGQARNTVASLVKNNLYIKNIAFAEANYKMGKAKLNVDYFKNLNAGSSDGQAHVVSDAYKIFGGGVTYVFDSNFKVAGEYYKNSAAAAKLADGSTPKATIVRLNYKGASAAKPGSWGMYVENNKFEGDVLPYAFQGPATKQNYSDVGLGKDGLKSWVVSGSYALAKGVTFDAYYQFNIKNAKTGVDAPSKTFTRAQINYMF